jgi:hypothetical protein
MHHEWSITTNLDYEEWHNFLGNKALVDREPEPLLLTVQAERGIDPGEEIA